MRLPVTTPALQQHPMKMQGQLRLYLGLYPLYIEGELAVPPGKEGNFSIVTVVFATNQTKL